MRTYGKAFAILSLILLFCIAGALLALLPAGRAGRRRLLTRNASFFARRALAVLGMRVVGRKHGRHAVRERSHLIVANHVSYTDIFVVASLRPAAFITSVELRNTFPLGLIALLGGCLFVERRSPAGLKKEIRAIEQTLRDGTSVVLFPEGTTSDGTTVRPFRNSLFTAAIATGTPVLPLCLRYRRINGRRIGDTLRDSLYFHGGMTYAQHVPRFLRLRSVHVECTGLDPIETTSDRTRKDLAAACHDAISAEYHRLR